MAASYCGRRMKEGEFYRKQKYAARLNGRQWLTSIRCDSKEIAQPAKERAGFR